VLLAHYMVDWTEYTGLSAEREGLVNQHRIAPQPGLRALHAHESLWFASVMQDWDAACHFATDSDGLFAVFESTTRIQLQRVADNLSPYFPIILQPYQCHVDPALKRAELYSAVTRRGLKLLPKLHG